MRVFFHQGSSFQWILPKTVSSVLGTALVDTMRRGQTVGPPELGQVDTSRGILRATQNWKQKEIITTSMFSKNEGVKRKETDRAAEEKECER